MSRTIIFFISLLFISGVLLPAQSSVKSLESKRLQVIKDLEFYQSELKSVNIENQEITKELDSVTEDTIETTAIPTSIPNPVSENISVQEKQILSQLIRQVAFDNLKADHPISDKEDFLKNKMYNENVLRQFYAHLLSRSEGEFLLASESVVTAPLTDEPTRIKKEKLSLLEDQRNIIKNKIKELELQRERLNTEIEKSLYSNAKSTPSQPSVSPPAEKVDNEVQEEYTYQQITIIEKSGLGAKMGFLPWPLVDGRRDKTYTGNKSKHFGVLSSIPSVIAVYEGRIASVTQNSSGVSTITIEHNHGYKTIYSNVKVSYVSAGQLISSQFVIGQASKSGGQYTIDFGLSENGINQNPHNWLKNN